MSDTFTNHGVHELLKSDRVHIIKFYETREDGSFDSNCSMTLSIIDGTLVVSGDLGDVVYEWHSPVYFSALSNVSVSKLNEKSQASETGRSYYW